MNVINQKYLTKFNNIKFRTLYCAKGNYEFGISRVMKSLEPYQKKLGTDTWFYTKRCFLALFENMAKHIILLKDSFIGEIIQFLTHCESNLVFFVFF
jgi:tetratricopeptide repeat protein 30